MNIYKRSSLLLIILALCAVCNVGFAQNKVVVIPLGGDDVSQCEVSENCEAGLATLTCPSGDIQIACTTPKRVFVTQDRFTANLGGLAGADAKCQQEAIDRDILSSEFKAWLSDSSESPSTRFTQSTAPYVMLNGVVIANSYADLIAGNGFAKINVIDYDEATDVTIISFLPSVWTNTLEDGVAGSSHCVDWSNDADGFGLTGSSDKIVSESTWTNFTTAQCVNSTRLYCFEQ